MRVNSAVLARRRNRVAGPRAPLELNMHGFHSYHRRCASQALRSPAIPTGWASCSGVRGLAIRVAPPWAWTPDHVADIKRVVEAPGVPPGIVPDLRCIPGTATRTRYALVERLGDLDRGKPVGEITQIRRTASALASGIPRWPQMRSPSTYITLPAFMTIGSDPCCSARSQRPRHPVQRLADQILSKMAPSRAATLNST